MAQPTLTESTDREPSAREIDELNQRQAIETRLAEQKALNSQNTTETPQSQESTQENLNPEQIENKLGAKKAEQNKPSATEQVKDVAVDMAKKQIMKQVIRMLFMPSTWIGIGWAFLIMCGIILALFIGFNLIMVYKCWEEGSWLSKGKMFYQYWSEDYAGIMNTIYSGTCAGDDNKKAPKKTPETPKTPESSSVGATSVTGEELDLLQPSAGPPGE